jgi:hypothetical protein
LKLFLPDRCGIFFVDEPSAAFYAIEAIAFTLRAAKFVFIAADHFLSERGWETLREIFESTLDAPAFLGVEDPDKGVPLRDSASCLAWTLRGYAQAIVDIPFVLEEPLNLDHFPRSGESAPRIIPGAVHVSRVRPVSAMAALINRSSRHNLGARSVHVHR